MLSHEYNTTTKKDHHHRHTLYVSECHTTETKRSAKQKK